MKEKCLVAINLCNSGSTGRIMMNVSEYVKRQGYEAYQAYPGHEKNNPLSDNDIIICSEFRKKVYQRICRYLGLNGCSAVIDTLRFLHKLSKIRPGIIHLHNIHHSYINLPLLFRYIKKQKIPVVWTLHDCWSFTGHCPHFAYIGCEKWKHGCYDCPQYKSYPESAFDDSGRMYFLKRAWFCGVENMVLVTPSQWLADLVGESFLRKYPVRVINNGIDLSVFCPIDSDFRKRYGIAYGMHMILAVAYGWGSGKKGLDVLIKLAQILPEDYRVVLVGTDDRIDTMLPPNIISIFHTSDQRELAEIYSAADLFVNPTREDTFPTVNIEALACGTPVLTFNTGGSPEIIDDRTGSVVDCDDFTAFYTEVRRICEEKPFSLEDCLRRAEMFSSANSHSKYFSLYEEVIKRS